MTTLGRKIIFFSLGTSNAKVIAGSIDEPSVVAKGHFVIYTVDQKRHVVPFSYLSNNIFVELLKLSEEEFGLSSHDPIMLPCDSALLEYIVFISDKAWRNTWRKLYLAPFLLVATPFALLFLKDKHANSHLFVDIEEITVEPVNDELT